MAVNTAPIFTRIAHVSWPVAIITSANTALDGTGTLGTNIHQAFVANADGSLLRELRFRALGTNVQTVARIFINNGSTNATADNNVLFDEITLPATTAAANNALAPVVMPMNLHLPNGYRVLVTIGTAVAAGYKVTAVGGDFNA